MKYKMIQFYIMLLIYLLIEIFYFVLTIIQNIFCTFDINTILFTQINKNNNCNNILCCLQTLICCVFLITQNIKFCIRNHFYKLFN